MNRKYKIKFWTGISVLLAVVLMATAVQANAHGPPGYNNPQLNNSNETNDNVYWGHMMGRYMGCH